MAAYGRHRVLLLNQRSVQRTAGNRLSTLLVFLCGATAVMAAWPRISDPATIVFIRGCRFTDLCM